MRTPHSSEQGAILIHVAICLMAMLLITGVVLDNGAMMTARAQAQTAADAGALAAATRLMEDSNGTLAAKEAVVYAQRNAVWGLSLDAADIIVPPLPFACPDTIKSCARVDVFRGEPDRTGTAHTNTISTFMMGLVGITAQGVRATATAQVAQGNAVSCIKPWIVADKWTDNSTGAAGGLIPSAWDQMDTWDPAVDTYSGTVDGFQASGPNSNVGTQLVLKAGNIGTYSAGWSQEIDFGTGNNSTSDYVAEIKSCPTWVPTVGLYDPTHPCVVKTDTDPEKGCINVKPGMSAGPTQKSVDDLVALDAGASWNDSTNTVQNGCMVTATCTDSNQQAVTLSPRIIPLALFNVKALAAESCSGNNCVTQVTNILGFFLEGMCDEVYPNQATRPQYCGTNAEARNAVVGRLMPYPGQVDAGAGSATASTFLKVVRLIR